MSNKLFSLQQLVHSVSRETFDNLLLFEKLVQHHGEKINLVSHNSLSTLWTRHILDSAQLFPYMDSQKNYLDIGTGAGFPGMVLALLGHSLILVEATKKKCDFLHSVSCETKVTPLILWKRVEDVEDSYGGVVSRACAPLKKLLAYTFPVLQKDGEAIFLKGKSVEEEMKEALKIWSFTYSLKPSKTSLDSWVCIIKKLRKR